MDSSLRTAVSVVGKAYFGAERTVMQHTSKASFRNGNCGWKKARVMLRPMFTDYPSSWKQWLKCRHPRLWIPQSMVERATRG
jgi:hypothetical protein